VNSASQNSLWFPGRHSMKVNDLVCRQGAGLCGRRGGHEIRGAILPLRCGPSLVFNSENDSEVRRRFLLDCSSESRRSSGCCRVPRGGSPYSRRAAMRRIARRNPCRGKDRRSCVAEVSPGYGCPRKRVAKAGAVIHVGGSKRAPRKSDVAANIEGIFVDRDRVGRTR
jgi:hypothetical protein